MLSRGDHLASLVALWNVAQGDTGQSGVCARLLLGLYNGARFPFDLTDLRRLDTALLRAAFDVVAQDATRAVPEVHEVLNRAYARRDCGHRLEHLAHAWGLRGRCARANLPGEGAAPLLLAPPQGQGQAAQAQAQAGQALVAGPVVGPAVGPVAGALR